MQLLLKQSGKKILSNQPKYFKILATRSLQGTAFVICGLLLTEAFAVSLLNQTPVNTHQRTPSYFRQITNVSPQAVKVGVDLCPTCIQFTGQAIDMLLNIILRKSTKIANFGIPNLQDFFFRIDSDFFSDRYVPHCDDIYDDRFLYLLGAYYIMISSTITFGYRIRCYWFLWSSLQRSCPENRKSGSRCRLQHLV